MTGLFTLLAGLGGVTITLRHQRRIRQQDRQDTRRLEQRDALVDLLDAGAAWSSTADGVVMFVSVVQDAVEIGNSDATERHGKTSEAYRHALVQARLVVTDEELRPRVLELSRHQSAFHTAIVPLIRNREGNKGHAVPERVGEATAYVNKHRVLLERLERTAVERLA